METVGSTELRAIKLTGRITKDHRLEVDLPLDVRAGEAEVIVLVSAAVPSAPADDRRPWLHELHQVRAALKDVPGSFADAIIAAREAERC